VELGRTVHAHGQTEAVRVEPVDLRIVEQGRVRGQAEVDLSPLFRGAALGVLDDLADQRQLRQRLAAEEDDVDALPPAALVEQELERGGRGLERHPLRRGGRGQVLLVAIAAGEVAAGRHVEHERRERRRADADRGARRRHAVADDAEFDQLAERARDVVAAGAAVEAAANVVGGDGRPLAEEIEQFAAERIELDEARRRHVEQDPPAVDPDLVHVVDVQAELAQSILLSGSADRARPAA
jgi:hypothetical protein